MSTPENPIPSMEASDSGRRRLSGLSRVLAKKGFMAVKGSWLYVGVWVEGVGFQSEGVEGFGS